MKVLFLHNTAPNYRIPFFLKVSERINIKYVFTSIDINKKIYGNELDFENLSKLEYLILENGIVSYFKIFKETKLKDVDVVVLPPLDSLREYLIGMIAFLSCKIYKKRSAYFWEKWDAPIETQNFKRRIKNKILKLFASIIYKRVDICLSPGIKNREYFIKSGVKEDNIRKIHDVSEVNITEFYNIREKYSIPQNRNIILYYGRIIKQKGLDILINAYSKLPKEQMDNIHLLIVGDGDFKSECENLAKKLKIDNITFVGYVHPNDRYNYFSQCDVFVHPGWFYEGRVDVWGLTLNEALQFGKVIISTNAVGASYELIKGNGIMINENNTLELKNALIDSIDENLKKNALFESKKIYEKYNYNSMSNDFINIVNEIRKK